MIRRFVLLVAAVIGCTIFIVPAYLAPDDLSKCQKPEPGTCEAADAIVAVSGGDTLARADEAVRLYKAGWGKHLIFSGAAADPDGPSNAEAMKQYAQAIGVDPSAISTEEFSHTTAENAINTALFITRNDIKKIILVTSPYHQRRASLEFSVRLGEDVTIVNHPVAHDRQWLDPWWLSPQSVYLAYSELVKISLFYVSRGVSF